MNKKLILLMLALVFVSVAATSTPITVAPTYAPTYILTMYGGEVMLQEHLVSGTNFYVVEVSPPNKHFVKWVGDTESMQDPFDPLALICMPSHDITVTATYAFGTDSTPYNSMNRWLTCDAQTTVTIAYMGGDIHGDIHAYMGNGMGHNIRKIVDMR